QDLREASSARAPRARIGCAGHEVSNLQGIPHYTHIVACTLKLSTILSPAAVPASHRSASLGGETLVSSLSQTLFFLLKWTLLGLAAAALVLWLRPQAPALQATPQESSAQVKPVVDASRAVAPLSV